MKIKLSQLRQIVREEIRRSLVQSIHEAEEKKDEPESDDDDGDDDDDKLPWE